jgi:hypothetical protein
MPSIDEDLLIRLYESGRIVCLAEQNNGYILQNLLRILFRRRKYSAGIERLLTINTLDSEGKPRFIHSGTYEELTDAFNLSAEKIARVVCDRASQS